MSDEDFEQDGWDPPCTFCLRTLFECTCDNCEECGEYWNYCLCGQDELFAEDDL